VKGETVQKPYRLLMLENRKLRERVAELERRCGTRAGAAAPGTDSRIFELVKQKDKALSDYAERMEQKARELETLVKELNARNEELGNGMAVLRLYQLMFENEPAGILGVDREGRIIQFNSAAVRYFGVGLHALRLQHVSALRLGGSEVDFEALFEETIDAESDVVRDVEASQGALQIRCYRLDDPSGLRGVVFRVSQPAGPAAE
jgi:PAS domain-containing protein